MTRWTVERTHIGCWIAYRQIDLTGGMLFRTQRAALRYAHADGVL